MTATRPSKLKQLWTTCHASPTSIGSTTNHLYSRKQISFRVKVISLLHSTYVHTCTVTVHTCVAVRTMYCSAVCTMYLRAYLYSNSTYSAYNSAVRKSTVVMCIKQMCMVYFCAFLILLN